MDVSTLSGITKVIIALGAGGVLAGAIALGASDGGGGPEPPAQVAAQTPPSVPEARPTPESSQSVVPRTDCAPDEDAYDDPDGRFSVCYPSAAVRAASHGPRGGPKRTVLTLREPADESVLSNTWTMRITWDDKTGLGLGPPSAETCPKYTGTGAKPVSSEFVKSVINGREFIGCLTKGNLSPGIPQLDGQELMLLSPVARDGSATEGYILIFINSTGPDFPITSQRSQAIVSKLRIR
jgi:hypothetical protein